MIVSIGAFKGGVGKSTIAINIALEFAKNSKVCVVDLDHINNTSYNFFTRHKHDNITVHNPQNIDIIAELITSNECDNFVFDLGGFESNLTIGASVVSDVICIPFRKGVIEEDSLTNYIEKLIVTADILEKDKRVILVPTMFHHAHSKQRILKEYSSLCELGLDIAEPISFSCRYGKALGDGKSVYEAGYMKQALEIKKLMELVSGD
jgi:chromosome partitioning protein